MKKMVKVKAFLLNIALLYIMMYPASAQDPGTVTIVQDPKIEALIARRLELKREAAGTTRVTAEGFRVQIFSGSDRDKTYQEQARFKSMYPAVNTYISYTQPNYKIRVGDFRTRLEAEKFMNQILKVYPTLFIFQERINFSI